MGSSNHGEEPKVSRERVTDEAKREALKSMGKYAAYTAPALISLVMVEPLRAAPRCSVAGPAGNPSKPPQC